MTDIQAWLTEARTLADKATDGPWDADGREITQHWQCEEPWQTIVGTEIACGPYCYGGSAEGVERDEDAAFIADARTRLPQALDAIQAVHDLHAPVDVEPSETICAACSNKLPNGRFMPVVEHPCPTAEALHTIIERTTK